MVAVETRLLVVAVLAAEALVLFLRLLLRVLSIRAVAEVESLE